jgi:hypothetical protein
LNNDYSVELTIKRILVELDVEILPNMTQPVTIILTGNGDERRAIEANTYIVGVDNFESDFRNLIQSKKIKRFAFYQFEFVIGIFPSYHLRFWCE